MASEDIAVCTGHRGEVTGLSSLGQDDPRFFVSCAEDGAVKLWDLRERRRDVLTVSGMPNGDELTEVAVLDFAGWGASPVVFATIGGASIGVADARMAGAAHVLGDATTTTTSSSSSSSGGGGGSRLLGVIAHPHGKEWCVFDGALSGASARPAVEWSVGDRRVFHVSDEDGEIFLFAADGLSLRQTALSSGALHGRAVGPEGMVLSLFDGGRIVGDEGFGSLENLAVGLASLPPHTAWGERQPLMVSVGMDARLSLYDRGTAELLQTVRVGDWGRDSVAGTMRNPPLPTSLSVACPAGDACDEPLLVVGRGDGSYVVLAPCSAASESSCDEDHDHDGRASGAARPHSRDHLEVALIAPGHECNGLVGAHLLPNVSSFSSSSSLRRLVVTVALTGEVSAWDVGPLLAPAEVGPEGSSGGGGSAESDDALPECVFACALRDQARGNPRSPITRLVCNTSCVLPSSSGSDSCIAVADALGRISVVTLAF